MKKLKLKIDWKKVFRFSGYIILGACFLASLGFTEHRRALLSCREVAVTVDDSYGNSFIRKQDVEQLIHDRFGDLVGMPLHSINISLLEKIIDSNPFVLKAQVFSTVDGKVVVEVRQRAPVVRVINAYNENFYIDDNGILMPTTEKFSAHVPVANGNIFNRETEQRIRRITKREISDTSFSPTLLEKIFMVAQYVRDHDFWNAQIEQIYVSKTGDLELVPRVGNQIILFGDEKDLEEKFNKLYAFYKEGLNKTGWNQYKTINITFKDQVVCSK